ncbi:hypothetical protein [Brevibacillus formosus]
MLVKRISIAGLLVLIFVIGIPNVINTVNDEARNFSVNEQGQTYGRVPYTAESTLEPDLMEAEGENGVVGYIKTSDLSPGVSSPEEAIAYQKSIEEVGYRSIPLYKSDGITVIGEFRLQSSK